MYKLPTNKTFWLKVITIVIAFFALISLLVASFNVCFIRTSVKGASMYPTLNYMYNQTRKQDIVYINRFATANEGDIVVLDLTKHPNFGNYSVKRLIATGGDKVKITLDVTKMELNLIVNNYTFYTKSYDEGFNTYNSLNQYISNHQQDSSRIVQDEDGDDCIIVKSNEIFVLGDNWTVSKDSSLVGPFNKNVLVGKVDIIVKPNQNELLQILKRIF